MEPGFNPREPIESCENSVWANASHLNPLVLLILSKKQVKPSKTYDRSLETITKQQNLMETGFNPREPIESCENSEPVNV